MPILNDQKQSSAGADSDTTGIITSPDWQIARLDEIPSEVVRLVGLSRHGPAWRWKLAGKMNDSRRARRTTDYGQELWQAIQFLAQSPNVVPDRLLEGHDVAVAEAHAIYCDRALRLQTEARILTGVGIEQVACVSGIEPTVIRDYCILFFDVVDKLPARSWIASNVIESPHEPECQIQRTMYRSAYFGGWYACEHWLSHYSRLGQDHDLSTADGRELERLELRLLADHLAKTDPERVSEVAVKLRTAINAKPHPEQSVTELLAAQVQRSLQAVLPLAEKRTVTEAPSAPPSAARFSA